MKTRTIELKENSVWINNFILRAQSRRITKNIFSENVCFGNIYWKKFISTTFIWITQWHNFFFSFTHFHSYICQRVTFFERNSFFFRKCKKNYFSIIRNNVISSMLSSVWQHTMECESHQKSINRRHCPTGSNLNMNQTRQYIYVCFFGIFHVQQQCKQLNRIYFELITKMSSSAPNTKKLAFFIQFYCIYHSVCWLQKLLVVYLHFSHRQSIKWM